MIICTHALTPSDEQSGAGAQLLWFSKKIMLVIYFVSTHFLGMLMKDSLTHFSSVSKESGGVTYINIIPCSGRGKPHL